MTLRSLAKLAITAQSLNVSRRRNYYSQSIRLRRVNTPPSEDNGSSPSPASDDYCYRRHFNENVNHLLSRRSHFTGETHEVVLVGSSLMWIGRVTR